MSAPVILPEQVKNDINIYLAPEENFLKAITSGSGKSVQGGQVWLILTSKSLFFHTCQLGKEPVIALLARHEINEIEYFQKAKEIVLTFIPKRNPLNTTRLSFAMEKREELEDFCEDLADLISFKKETAVGVKSFPASQAPSRATATTPAVVTTKAPPASSSTPHMPELRHAASSTRHHNRTAPVQSTVTTPIAVPQADADADADANANADSVDRTPEVKIVSQTSRPSTAAVASANIGEGVKASYIIIATIVSVLVAFLWYQFFKTLSNTRQ